jgi:hypothetical protein
VSISDNQQLLASEMLLSDEHLRAAGCLALESTHLDMYVTSLIELLCGFDDSRSKLFIGRLTLGPKVKIMRDLIWPIVSGTPEGEEFNVIYEGINSFIENRNTVIHGDWGLARMTPRDILSRKAPGVGILRDRSVKADEVMKHARHASKLQGDLLQWYSEHLWEPNDEEE